MRSTTAPPVALDSPTLVSASTTGPQGHSWEELSHLIGSPSRHDLEIFGVHQPGLEPIEVSSRLRSERILGDLQRWLGLIYDFWAAASADQQELVLGFCWELLQVVLYQALELRRLVQMLAPPGAADSELSQASRTLERALLRRNQFWAALRAAAINEPLYRAQIDTAFGSACDWRSAAASLRALATLGRTMLADRSSPEARRLVATGLTEALCQALDGLAAQLHASHERTALLAPNPLREELDWQDAVCLTHMKVLKDIFDAAQPQDPSVPHLLPVATRHLLTVPPRRPGDSCPPSSLIPMALR